MRIARDGAWWPPTAARCALRADTLCLHGDNPRAADNARAVRAGPGGGRASAVRPAGRVSARPRAAPRRRRGAQRRARRRHRPRRSTRACARSTRALRAARRFPGCARPCPPTARCWSSSIPRAPGPRRGRAARRWPRPAAAPAPPRAPATTCRSSTAARTAPTSRRWRRHCGPQRRARSWRATPPASTPRSCSGFMPGFAYLGLLPPELDTPRRATPRVRVPAGSVAVAGRQTAVYPVSLARRLAPDRPHVARALRPARRSAGAHPARRPRALRARRTAAGAEPPRARARPAPAVAPRSRWSSAGLLTTVQDGGRPRLAPPGRAAGAGAMDAPALRRGQRGRRQRAGRGGARVHAAGPDAALPGARPLRGGRRRPRRRAGARRPRPLAGAARARRCWRGRATCCASRARRAGCRAYVAFAGGIDVPPVLGSRATDLTAGFGGLEGRPLRAGDRLAVGLAAATGPARRPRRRAPPPAAGDAAELRVVPGPAGRPFAAGGPARVPRARLPRCSPTSDRVGCRLDGPAARASRRGGDRRPTACCPAASRCRPTASPS